VRGKFLLYDAGAIEPKGRLRMDADRIAEAASLLATARRDSKRIARLPEACRPSSAADAHAIQDAVTALLGGEVRAYKANAPVAGDPNSLGVRAPIYAANTRTSPAEFPVAEAPQCGVEGEVAFRFRHDLPPRAAPYSREEVSAAVDACAAIEVVSSRFADPDNASPREKLADCISNAGFVFGAMVSGWRALDIANLKVRLTVNGETVLEQVGGHPIGDPVGVAVAFVEMMRTAGGVGAGQFITCGSCTGLRYLNPGDTCGVTFEGLGDAELQFAP
jgi:2-keto-4-pentenoate hydratase